MGAGHSRRDVSRVLSNLVLQAPQDVTRYAASAPPRVIKSGDAPRFVGPRRDAACIGGAGGLRQGTVQLLVRGTGSLRAPSNPGRGELQLSAGRSALLVSVTGAATSFMLNLLSRYVPG
jgi:hypothetical protein